MSCIVIRFITIGRGNGTFNILGLGYFGAYGHTIPLAADLCLFS
jgi:hypothetical protein